MTLQEKIETDRQTVPRAMVFFVEGKFYGGYERTAWLATRLLPKLKATGRSHGNAPTAWEGASSRQT